MLTAACRRAMLSRNNFSNWYDSSWLSYKINYSGRWSKIIPVMVAANCERDLICQLKALMQLGLPSTLWNHRISGSERLRVVEHAGDIGRMQVCNQMHMQPDVKISGLLSFCASWASGPPHEAIALSGFAARKWKSSRVYKINFCMGTTGCFPRLENVERSVWLLCKTHMYTADFFLKLFLWNERLLTHIFLLYSELPVLDIIRVKNLWQLNKNIKLMIQRLKWVTCCIVIVSTAVKWKTMLRRCLLI